MNLRTFIEEISTKAAEITLEYFNSPTLTVDHKGDTSPVTIADREAEQYLRREIEKHFPEDGIIGEEFGNKESKNATRWIIDPIDGTKTFIHGVPLYGTLVAREEGGVITHGVTIIPPLKEMVVAERGKGAFWNGKQCHVSTKSSLKESLFVTTDDARFRNRVGSEFYQSFCNHMGMYRTWGDCYGYLLVATGRAEIMIDAKIAVWDIAPISLIIEEAGGDYSTFSAEKTHTGPDFITTNGILHQEVLSLLQGR